MIAYVHKYKRAKRLKDTWHQFAAYTDLFPILNYYWNSKSLFKLHSVTNLTYALKRPHKLHNITYPGQGNMVYGKT
jgi:hypothetical protein